jgi:transposase
MRRPVHPDGVPLGLQNHNGLGWAHSSGGLAVNYATMRVPALTIGLDLGERKTHLIALRHDGEISADERLSTTPAAIEKRFRSFPSARVVMEVGTSSPWVSRLLASLGHEVIVANPRSLGDRGRQRRKNDRIDALSLAARGRTEPMSLRPIKHRSKEAQHLLNAIRARDALVRSRTLLVNSVRSIVKSSALRVPSCSTPAFPKKARSYLPKEMCDLVDPLLEQIEGATEQIKKYDKVASKLCSERFPETKPLLQVGGVGNLCALSFVLTLEDPKRFRKSRDVGAFLGMVPRLSDSGDGSPQLKISKTGDRYLRRLLVTSAQYILGPFGKDCDLRKHGEAIARRGGKNAKKRAVVAVARKLAVLLHRLWITQGTYDPLYNTNRRAKQAEAAA